MNIMRISTKRQKLYKKKTQILELKNKTELKNSLGKFNNRLDKALKNQ